MAFVKESFGTTKDGIEANIYTISNSNGMTARFTDYGAILVGLIVPDREGNPTDVVLGFDYLEGYYYNGPYFGATIGRNANRTSGGKFKLDGKKYKLEKNEWMNNLHSGPNGYHKRLWDADYYEDELGQTITFSLTSPHMDQGFPGELEVVVRYIITEDNCLIIEYEAESNEDTVVNLTNHSYFNLSGQASGDVLNHRVWIDSDSFTPVEGLLIPTGEIASVKGTPMDFTVEKTIGEGIKEAMESGYKQIERYRGYDHNYVLKTTRDEVSLVAKAKSMETGIAMEVYTDMPGVQFYTAAGLHEKFHCKFGVTYQGFGGFCLETQYFPDAMNVEGFEKPILRAGDVYESTTVYKFITE